MQVGRLYYYRCGDFVHTHVKWKVEEFDGRHYIARSVDCLECRVFVDESGRHVGNRHGMYENPVNVWMVPVTL